MTSPEAGDDEQDEAVVEPEVLQPPVHDARSISVEATRGMMPPPKMLDGYQDLYPDAVEWFFDRALREERHRHHIDREQVRLAEDADRRSHRQVMFSLATTGLVPLALVAAAIVALIADVHWSISLVFGSSASALVARAAWRRASSENEEQS